MGVSLHTFSFKIGFKRVRKESGYTQQSFSDKFGISIETVKNWEQGRNVPELDTIYKLCDFFNCDMDYLFDNISCKTHDTQFIQDTLGLSYNTIKHIISLNEDNDSFICIPIIDHLLGKTEFTHFLMKQINEYYHKYEIFREADYTYNEESNEIQKKYGNNVIAIKEATDSGEINRSVSRHDLAKYQDIAEAKHFKIQKEFDNILIDLVKYYYDLNHSSDKN